jgi:hypothetical protein
MVASSQNPDGYPEETICPSGGRSDTKRYDVLSVVKVQKRYDDLSVKTLRCTVGSQLGFYASKER